MLKLDQIIGRGGFGTVFRGTLRTDDGLTRRVAVKVLSDEMSGDARAISRLRDEARLLALLDHPALVPVYALQFVDNRLSVVMGLVDGVDLRELLSAVGRIPPRCACEIAIQTAEALHAMWTQPHPETGEPLRVVHRDIKPHNMMVDRGGRLRLLDLGVASARFEAREASTRGGVAGTLAYMSPQRWGRVNDANKGDVYALGATLFHMVAGDLPPEAGNTPDAHLAAMDASFEKAAGALVGPIRAALTWDHQERPSAEKLADQLREVKDQLAGPELRDWARVAIPDILEQRAGRAPNTGEQLLGSSWDLTPATTGEDMVTGWIFDEDSGELRSVRPEPSRAALVIGAMFGALFVGGAVLALAISVASAPTGPVLRFAVPPVNPPDVMAEALAPLNAHLEARLGRPVQMTVADSYGATLEIFERGDAEIALLTPLLYVSAEAEGPLNALAMTDPVVMSGHEGVLLVAPDVAGLEDLKGATVCFTDPNSTSGFLLPRRYLRKNGLFPDRDYTAHISGGHKQAVADLAEGKCQAAGTYGNAYSDAIRRGKTNGAQIFARTGLAAHNTVACAVGTDPEHCDAVREALLSFDPGEDTSEAFRINGFVEHDREVYADLIAAWAEEQAKQ